jgi:hypothetical protein
MDIFNFDAMVELAKADPIKFEQMRIQAINEYINTLPDPQRKKCITLQKELDELRITTSPEDYLVILARKMNEYVEDMNDQIRALQAIIEKDSNYKPHLESIKAYVNTEFTQKL